MTFMQFQGPGFVMEVPTDWLITSSTQFQTMFLSSDSTEGVRPNLIVTVRPANDDVTPFAVAEEAKYTQQREYPNYQIIDEVDYTRTGGSGFLRRYIWQNPENLADISQIQAFFVVANVLYTLTATRLQNTNTDVDEIFSHMIDSFRVTGTPVTF